MYSMYWWISSRSWLYLRGFNPRFIHCIYVVHSSRCFVSALLILVKGEILCLHCSFCLQERGLAPLNAQPSPFRYRNLRQSFLRSMYFFLLFLSHYGLSSPFWLGFVLRRSTSRLVYCFPHHLSFLPSRCVILPVLIVSQWPRKPMLLWTQGSGLF